MSYLKIKRQKSPDLDEKLFVAVKQGILHEIQALIQEGADVQAVNPEDGNKLIHVAAQFGHLHVLKYLLVVGLDIDSTGKDDITPLHVASKHGQLEAALFLVDNGADMFVESDAGQLPIHVAAEHGHKDIIITFLNRGQDIDTDTGDHLTALHYASKHGHFQLVQYLVENGANVDAMGYCKPMHLAAESGHKDILEYLLANGNQLDDKTDWGSPTLLHLASSNGHLDIVLFLIAKNADIHAKSNIFGQKAIHLAARAGHTDVVRVFLDLGIGMEDTDSFEHTILHEASHSGSNLVRYLIDNNANVHAKTFKNETPIHFAAMSGSTEVIELLLNEGNAINATDEHGRTPLYFASMYGCLKVTQFLIDNGADIHAKCWDSRTPMHYASQSGHAAVVEIFLKNGANIGDADEDGMTSFHLASSEGHLEVVQLLVDKNADVNAKFKTGRTALHCACLNGHVNVVEYLSTLEQVNIDAEDDNGSTPLHAASRNSDLDHRIRMVKCLLDAGAKSNINDNWGHSALFYYIKFDDIYDFNEKFYSVDQAILEKMNYTDIDVTKLKTAAHVVISKYYLDLRHIKLVLQYQKDLNAEDIFGKTPLNYLTDHTVNEETYFELIRFLVNRGAYLKASDCQQIVESVDIQKELFTDVNFCTQCIVNKFNNKDLPKLYKLSLATKLPPLKIMEANDTQVRMIQLAVEEEISKNEFCDVSKMKPVSLAMLCVDTCISYSCHL